MTSSGIRDNHRRGSIGEFLKEKILEGSDLSFVSAYFTIQKRAAARLQSGRDFVIPNRQEQATDGSDFELITWLVIKIRDHRWLISKRS